MKITITVSDGYFQREIEDHFQEFFERVIADIGDGSCGWYELETATLLKEAFANGRYDEEEK